VERLRSNSLLLVKSWFYVAFIIYAAALMVGAIAGLFTGSMIAEGANASSDTQEISVLYIFSHNLKINIFSIVSGLFFGFVPAIILVVNGLTVGYVIMVVLAYYPSIPSLAIFYAIAPHAVPELFALFFSCALGFRLFVLSLNLKAVRIRKEFAFLVLGVFIITVSTYTAAYIETNITGVLVEKTFPQLLQP